MLLDTSNNMCKVIYLIATEDAGRKNYGIPYLSKYPDQFSDAINFPCCSSPLMYQFFGSVNEVTHHEKSRQSYLALEKYWVTQCGWIWLCTAFDIGMTIPNLWKLLFCGIKIDCDENDWHQRIIKTTCSCLSQ